MLNCNGYRFNVSFSCVGKYRHEFGYYAGSRNSIAIYQFWRYCNGGQFERNRYHFQYLDSPSKDSVLINLLDYIFILTYTMIEAVLVFLWGNFDEKGLGRRYLGCRQKEHYFFDSLTTIFT